jgi:predicted CXXCH cytochrome family protein
MSIRPALLAALACAALAATAHAADKAGKKSLAPIPAAEAVTTHGPFEQGDCAVCHEKSDPAAPGKITKPADELCYDCHDEFKGKAPKKMKHPKSGSCVGCHNPHNSKNKSLRH